MGTRIEGAAIRIGEQLVFTNADGEFFIRRNKAGALALEVVLTEFLNSAPFHLVSAPTSVKVYPEGAAPDFAIVLARK
jgi:hypothetical protein